MAQMNFRIIIVPQDDTAVQKSNLLAQVKHAVQASGLLGATINYSQVKRSEDDDYPEIEQLSFEVQAETEASNPKQKVLRYQEFCSKWKQHFNSLPCSYIELYGNDCFLRSKSSHHRVSYEDISFGVLPHNGMFNRYAILTQNQGFIDFYHDTRNVVVQHGDYELTFSYENIRNIFVNIQSKPCEIFFDLFNPPVVFRVERKSNRYQSYDLKHRSLNICTAAAIDIDVFGRSNMLCLSLKTPDEADKILAGIHFHSSEKPVHYSCITAMWKDVPSDPVLENMHFGCAYLITAMFKRNFTTISQTSDAPQNIKRLYSLSEKFPETLEKALTAVLASLDSGKILNYWHAIHKQYDHYSSNKDEINFRDYIIPSKCCMIRRIMITPTRQLLWPPEVMYGNRVLRNYDSEYALRVSFRDDNMSRMSFNAQYADSSVLDMCIKRPMRSGIRIGSRKYEFLAWSNSQIRDHGVWLYARDQKGNTSANIRQWMGDFSHIRNVPKYMARMGQCFSQTEDAISVPLDAQHVRTEPDVEGGWDNVNSKPYCFSDGVGRISKELAKKVHDALGHDRLCSAFQIRYGGCKGMLVVDPTLKDAQIVFRKSMKKFDSPQNQRLEIAKTSGPVSLQLNRPFIALLNDLGVRHRTFLRLQEDMLTTLTDMLFNEKKAAQFLKSKTPSALYDYEDLSASGICLTTEPFFKSLLLALHRHHIGKIKSSGNIAIDPSKGRNMLGVMDETGTLEYGQVFVQYTTDIAYGETTRATTIRRGQVLVTKNPCLHPGDVRKFNAVNVRALHHIVDCIVFPQKGKRPHPNEMAGSDLDGDEYSVLWFDDLIFYGPNQPPADFPEIHSPDVPYIKVDFMIDFLQDYIRNDQVGTIANAHLAHADNNGIFSEYCLEIAKKFSVAVDFAKNGKSQSLTRDERPTEFPDFMEKFHRGVYKSDKALGKMYRVCRDFESENEETSIAYHDIEVDPQLIYEGWEKYKDSALKSRNKYNALFRSVLRNYGIQHEAEALSGAFTNLHCRFHERKDRNEIEKVIVGCVKMLKKRMLDEFLEEFLNSGDIAANDIMMRQKASAWYQVTYSDPEAKFLSFPWIVGKYLVNIKVEHTQAKPLPFSPAILNMDDKIRECDSNQLLPPVTQKSWNDYHTVCKPDTIKLALQTLLLWAQDEEILGSFSQQGLLSTDTFIKIFLHVAEQEKYLTRTHINQNIPSTSYSPGYLCLAFLKFCSTFRFYNKHEIRDILPFHVRYYNKIAKRAIVSYHRFALSGMFQNLYFDRKVEEELIRMKPIYIESKIFGASRINSDSLKKAEEALVKYSKAEEVSLREILQTKKVCVSAKGTEQALKELKSILRKKHIVLGQLFKTGIMPATV
uniref:RNA-dependent RNA polymerase n=1 Tax=Cupiennius salei TaxID=6928 RepID=T1E1M1_CUPSA